jgi:hypothetical protein
VAPAAVARTALRIGGELTLNGFKVWRRNLSCLDALILLAITRSNVDGILYDRELRRRFGGANRIAPDDLRQPVSPSVLAISLGLPELLVQRRCLALARKGECQLTSSGMLITQHQVEATNRREMVESYYVALREAYWKFHGLGFFDLVGLPPIETAKALPVRSAAAHCAKYMLRLLENLGAHVGDPTNALLLLEIAGQNSRPASADEGQVGHDVQPADIRAAATALGLTYRSASRRSDGLVARGFCGPLRGGVVANAGERAWIGDVGIRNVGDLFQLFAGLAEVGAIADFRDRSA